MASKLIEVADAVATLLTSTVTAAGGTIARSYVPRRELRDAENLYVAVVPREEARSLAARGRIQSDHSIDVGVVQRATTDDLADDRMDFADSLAEYMEENQLPLATGARLVSVAFQPTFDATSLYESGLFVSVIRAVYRTMRSTE